MNARMDWVALVLLLAGCRQQPANTAAQSGRDIYLARCAVCHGVDREGIPGMYPPLKGAEWVDGPPKRMAAIILDGIQARVGKMDAIMPAGATVMNDAEIASVMTWLRAADGKPPVTPVEVEHVRIVTAARNTFWTMDDLRNIPIP